LGTNTVVGILVITALSLVSMVYYLRNKTRQAFISHKREEAIVKRHKILSLIPESVEAE
jgi:uncharacterized membrane protein